MLDARVDLRVALVALAVGLLSALLAGLLPAIRATRADLNAMLKAMELRFAASRGWMRQALVVAQVAVALVMMILSGLFLETIRVARTSDPGFRIENVLTMGVDPHIGGYDLDATRTFYRRLLARVEMLPGVRNAAIGEHLPLGVASSATDISIPRYDLVDPDQPIYEVRTMALHFEQQGLWGVRLVAEVISAVGVVGLALGVLGLYAVIAYSVGQRTREIGIRMAIGASERRVLGMVLGQGFVLSAIGITVGLLLTLALRTAVGDLLNGVNPREPAVYAGATIVLLSVTLFATYLPARRASHVDAQSALRAE